VTLAQGFPGRTLKGSREIYRIHRVETGAWWFSSDGSGRFDPLGTRLGACYLAEQPLGAWIEVFRRRMLLAEAEVLRRVLLSVKLGRDLKLADLTSRRALQFDVTASLGANEGYVASQALAARAVQAGFDGLRYLVRHDPAQRLYGIALFAEPGASSDHRAWPCERDAAIPDALIDEASRPFGYRVLPTP
jgi:RES domain-containing protein